jgi:hypothetical protein
MNVDIVLLLFNADDVRPLSPAAPSPAAVTTHSLLLDFDAWDNSTSSW